MRNMRIGLQRQSASYTILPSCQFHSKAKWWWYDMTQTHKGWHGRGAISSLLLSPVCFVFLHTFQHLSSLALQASLLWLRGNSQVMGQYYNLNFFILVEGFFDKDASWGIADGGTETQRDSEEREAGFWSSSSHVIYAYNKPNSCKFFSGTASGICVSLSWSLACFPHWPYVYFLHFWGFVAKVTIYTSTLVRS